MTERLHKMTETPQFKGEAIMPSDIVLSGDVQTLAAAMTDEEYRALIIQVYRAQMETVKFCRDMAELIGTLQKMGPMAMLKGGASAMVPPAFLSTNNKR